MTSNEILEVIRQRIGQAVSEIDGDPPIYGDDFLLSYVKTANFNLTVLGVTTGITVSSSSITPDATIDIGMLLASGAAALIIGDDLLNRLKNGELGLSFSTGASQISTNQAAINLKSSGDQIKHWHDMLLAVYLSRDPNAVILRAQ